MAAKGSVSELVGWVMVMVGALLAISAGRQVADYFGSADEWVRTEATVVRTRMVKASPVVAAGTVRANTLAPLRVYHDVVYFREGNRYQESVEFGQFKSTEEAVSVLESTARPGSVLQVWVNASNPRDVRLEPESRRIGGWSIGLFLLTGLGALHGGARLIGMHPRPVAGMHGRPVPAA